MSAITDKRVNAVEYHGALAGAWEQRYQKKSFRVRLEVLTECLPSEDLTHEYWLDAGCGTGTLSRALAGHGARVVGVDAAPPMVEKARSFAERSTLAHLLEFHEVHNIDRLPFPDQTFDGVLCSSVLEYLADPDECLASFVRVLRPGGMLIVSVPNRASLTRQAQAVCRTLGRRFGRKWFEYLNISRNWYSQDEFRRKLAAHSLVEQRTIIFGGPFCRRMQSLPIWGSLMMFAARRSQ